MVKKIIESGDLACLGVEPAASVDKGGKEYKQLPRGPPATLLLHLGPPSYT